MTRYNSLLAAIAITLALAGSSAAQQVSSTDQIGPPAWSCGWCIFPAIEPESSATPGEGNDNSQWFVFGRRPVAEAPAAPLATLEAAPLGVAQAGLVP